jgi:drug/metabolite transporter (DMT)-like permease
MHAAYLDHPLGRTRSAPAAGPVAIATLLAVRAFAVGQAVATSTRRHRPRACSGWPCGITAQSAGYLLISISLPRLPAIITSVILLSQPVMSMGLAIVLLGETPSAVQLLGVGLVIGGIAAATVPVARLRDGLQRTRPAPTTD